MVKILVNLLEKHGYKILTVDEYDLLKSEKYKTSERVTAKQILNEWLCGGTNDK